MTSEGKVEVVVPEECLESFRYLFNMMDFYQENTGREHLRKIAKVSEVLLDRCVCVKNTYEGVMALNDGLAKKVTELERVEKKVTGRENRERPPTPLPILHLYDEDD